MPSWPTWMTLAFIGSPGLLHHRRVAAVDRDRGAGDEVGRRAREEDRDPLELVRRSPAAGRRARDDALAQTGDLPAPGLCQLGIDPARQHRIDLDPVRRP